MEDNAPEPGSKEYHLKRVGLFNDSFEIALALEELADRHHKPGQYTDEEYWLREAAVHIVGLWECVKGISGYIEEPYDPDDEPEDPDDPEPEEYHDPQLDRAA
jgi:hypothetical protein